MGQVQVPFSLRADGAMSQTVIQPKVSIACEAYLLVVMYECNMR